MLAYHSLANYNLNFNNEQVNALVTVTISTCFREVRHFKSGRLATNQTKVCGSAEPPGERWDSRLKYTTTTSCRIILSNQNVTKCQRGTVGLSRLLDLVDLGFVRSLNWCGILFSTIKGRKQIQSA